MHEIKVIIAGEQVGKDLQSLLRGELKISYSQYKRLKFNQGIYVDGILRHSDFVVKAGQTVRLVFRDGEIKRVYSGTQPLIVAYEDDDLLIVSKPAPLPSVASNQGGETLENRVYSYLGEPLDFVYRPVNRLDKGTSGLMMVAKNAHIQARMQGLLHTDRFAREYLAIVLGRLTEKSGSISLPIRRGEGIRRQIDEQGQTALTRYEVASEFGEYSLVSLRLLTGRTHQIRVHLAALGCPVVGDFLYGREDERLIGRFALHANSVRFYHPLIVKWVEVKDVMPAKMQEIIDHPAT